MQLLCNFNEAGYADLQIQILWGLQCPKLLWHAYNAKHLVPEPDAQTQAIFDQGHEIGALASQLFPTGIEIAPGVADFDEVPALTEEALKQRRPMFEAAFQFHGGYARADILNPVGGHHWDLVEVKSTAVVKDTHPHDLAFQAFVLAGAGLKIRHCTLAHINKDFIKRGPIDPTQFFTLEDVTAVPRERPPFPRPAHSASVARRAGRELGAPNLRPPR